MIFQPTVRPSKDTQAIYVRIVVHGTRCELALKQTIVSAPRLLLQIRRQHSETLKDMGILQL
jgi:hypothetical protein